MSLTSRFAANCLVTFRVDLREVSPLLRQIVQLENCLDGAYRHARAAVDAFLRIYIELCRGFKIRFVLSWMDAVYRTSIYAGGILYADAGLGNDVRH